MLKEKSKTAVSWALAIICMIVIFWLSSRTATESAEQSGSVLRWLINIFGDNFLTDFIVRKSAHCLEFTGLCLLLCNAFYQTLKSCNPSVILSILCTSLYASTDELHQLFVAGRACRIGDWAIDTAGAVLGALSFLIIYTIISKVKSSKKENIDS